MKKLSFILVILSSILKMVADEPRYEIKAYEGTIFQCGIYPQNAYITGFMGVILDDTTYVDCSSEKAFINSFLKKIKYAYFGPEIFYFDAYNILYPNCTDARDNYKMAEKLKLDFRELYYKFEKEITFQLSTGECCRLSYCRVKGLFLSIYDYELQQRFTASDDISTEFLAQIKDYNIPIAIFECKESDHIFIVE